MTTSSVVSRKMTSSLSLSVISEGSYLNLLAVIGMTRGVGCARTVIRPATAARPTAAPALRIIRRRVCMALALSDRQFVDVVVHRLALRFDLPETKTLVRRIGIP